MMGTSEGTSEIASKLIGNTNISSSKRRSRCLRTDATFAARMLFLCTDCGIHCNVICSKIFSVSSNCMCIQSVRNLNIKTSEACKKLMKLYKETVPNLKVRECIENLDKLEEEKSFRNLLVLLKKITKGSFRFSTDLLTLIRVNIYFYHTYYIIYCLMKITVQNPSLSLRYIEHRPL